MSIYIAQSPYRSSFKGGFKRRSRRGLLSGASSFTGLFQTKRSGVAMVQHMDRKEEGALSMFQQVKSKKVRFEFGPTSVMVGFIALALLMSVLHLMHFNNVASRGCALKRLDASHQQLLSQYEITNMKLAEYKSLNNIVASDKVDTMRRPANVMFVSGNTALASK